MISSNINPRLIVFAAPSGSGKTTIVKHLLQQFKNQLAFSISATTRKKRPGEQEGRDYYFLTPKFFQDLIAKDAFLEYEEVYSGCFYGTLIDEINRITQAGKAVIFDIDVEGALTIKKKFGQQAFLIFVKPPDIDELKNRLKKRGTDSDDMLHQRLAKAEKEMQYAPKFDYVLINEKLELTLQEAERITNDFLNRK